MRSHYKRLGDYVTQVKLKNTDSAVSVLKGININKYFMPSVANINGTDLSKYRVVKKNQFAFNPMHVGRDEVLPISMLEDDEPIIVSPAYIVFQVKDEQKLLPDYLMMWCRRSEFDRNAWFMTDNSVRGGFSWDDFCSMELPVPPIEKQREIVREYNVVNDRIALNEKLTQMLEDTEQAIYKQWFVDFEFPISKEYADSIGKPELEGKPYKSSGGEMVHCEKLEKAIPIKWKIGCFTDICEITMGQSPKGDTYNTDCLGTALVNGPMEFGRYFVNKSKWTTSPTKICRVNDLIVCIRGSTGRFVVSDDFYCLGRGVCSFSSNKHQEYVNLVYKNSLKELLTLTTGSIFSSWSKDDLNSISILLPPEKLLALFETLMMKITKSIKLLQKENEQLVLIYKLLMVKLSKV